MRAVVVFWAVTAGLVLLCLAALPTIAVFPFEMLANLTPQLAFAALLFAIACIGLGRWSSGAVALLLVPALLFSAREMFTPRSAEPSGGLKIVWANVFKDEHALRRLADLARREGADVVVLGEPPAGDAAVRAILGDWPHSAGRVEPYDHGVIIFSRTPLANVTISGPFLGGGYPIVAAEVGAATARVRVVGLHPAVPGSPARLHARDAQILAAARWAEAAGSSIIIGDLNATPWTTALRKVRQSTTVRRASSGFASTWFSPLPLLGLPIDHALFTRDMRASARVGPGIGSDNLPLIVRAAPAP